MAEIGAPPRGAGLTDGVDRFLAHLHDERRYSPSTIGHYAHALAGLAGFAQQQGARRWHELQPDQVQAWLADEHRRRGYAPATLRGIASAWRSFFRFLAREGEMTTNPATGLRSPKVRRKLPEVLDADEMSALVEVPGDDAEAVRDRALLELLYSSGLRVAELCGVRWRDLDPGEGMLRVTGKGSKTRIVPVGAKALAALSQKAGWSGLTQKFLGTLAQNRRLAELPAIIEAVLAEAAAHRGELTAHVTVAEALAPAQKDQLVAALQKLTGKNVNIDVTQDAAIIGGLIVKVGSKLIDGSVRSKLERLHRVLKNQNASQGQKKIREVA